MSFKDSLEYFIYISIFVLFITASFEVLSYYFRCTRFNKKNKKNKKKKLRLK